LRVFIDELLYLVHFRPFLPEYPPKR
jgi:hypothetical protein